MLAALGRGRGGSQARLSQVTAPLARSSRKTRWGRLPEAVAGRDGGALRGRRDQPLQRARAARLQPGVAAAVGLAASRTVGLGESSGTGLTPPQPLSSSFTSLLRCHYRIHGRMPLLTTTLNWLFPSDFKCSLIFCTTAYFPFCSLSLFLTKTVVFSTFFFKCKFLVFIVFERFYFCRLKTPLTEILNTGKKKKKQQKKTGLCVCLLKRGKQ